MRILILGGTRLIGREILTTLLTGEHKVTILTQARTIDELPGQVQRLRRDRDVGVAG